MHSIITKMSVGVASTVLAFGVFVPRVFADVTIEGNGDSSNNSATVTNSNSTTIGQTNVQTVQVVATSNANTGGNDVKHNTGDGTNSVDTGNATSVTGVIVTGGTNKALVTEPCGCVDPGDVTIADNGDSSHNTVKVKNKSKTTVGQTNVSTVGVSAHSNAKTGKNVVSHNTGDGDNTVTTGRARSATFVVVKGPKNSLTL